MEKASLKKTLITLLKIAVSLVLLILVFRKINFQEVAEVLKHVHFIPLFFASILFFSSQVLSAKRLEFYLKAQDFNLSFKSNFELYFLGMFYNFFIPGGVGGDAYKIYLLHQNFDWSAKKLTSALFNDRLSGLLAIIILICGFASYLFDNQYLILFLLIILIVILSSFQLSKKIFPAYKSIFFKTFFISVLIQVLQVSCFLFLLKSLGVNENYLIYALVFLASSVLSLISFAGIGVREMLFFQAAKYFDFNATISVSASLLFTLITAIFSFIGVYFQIRKLNLNLAENKSE
ncbi:lysylphosphatidylglycerol synthase transmembrane domain-containing protein [Halpernia frigidisoli]|uniref:Lysylphosphatidylglycerol synthetase n=1 Tax=Halpernia frigidisoli TaxID=1125876 RepID=A0A1I3J300_9FLAO|nr:lysylphosphatidylglycerol synthase transmembrane domain-containing protein [Halpernia frigidisoli]SFI54671.1 hypothetical protein SAMN05443292_2909 [Halpernia frigidisoli]